MEGTYASLSVLGAVGSSLWFIAARGSLVSRPGLEPWHLKAES